MTGIGKLLLVAAQALGAVVWLGTAWLLYDDGRSGLALLALLVPPADIVLMFLTPLWPAGLAALALLLAGTAMMRD